MIDYNNRIKIVGERIKEERKRKKWTKVDLLIKIYMAASSHKTLTAWENGERMPDLTSLARMAEVFQCDIGYLLGDYDERTRTLADIVEETWLSEKAVQNILYMKECDFNALAALSVFLETYLPGGRFGPVCNPDRDSAAGAVLGYIGMPKPSGSLALSPDGTTIVSTVNESGLLPAELSALQITLSDAARMVLHEKILKQLDLLRGKYGGQHQRETRNQDLENISTQNAYDAARQHLRGGDNG